MVWLKRGAIALVTILVLALAILYGASEWALRRDRGVPLTPIVADRSPAGIAEGARLVRLEGCFDCHNEGHGRIFIHNPMIGTIGPPALAPLVAAATDAELARSTRQGVSRTGRQLYIMPPHPHLADDDMARMIGYLRTLKPSAADLQVTRSFGPLGRFLILNGAIEATPHPALDGGAHRSVDSGAYFARNVCLGCHDLYRDSRVDPENVTPALAPLAGAYDLAALTRLLRTGRGLSKPDLGLMSEVSRKALHLLTDAEIAGIKTYLDKRAAEAPTQ